MFSTITTAPSMIRPKSIAPRLIRFPEMPKLHHAGHREEHRERDDERDDDRGAPVAEQREEDDDHEHRAFDEVRLDGAGSCDSPAPSGRKADGSRRRAGASLNVVELSRRTAARRGASFRPASMIAAPTSASSPSSVLAPVRKFVPMPTVATSPSRIGFTPARELQRDLRDLLGAS